MKPLNAPEGDTPEGPEVSGILYESPGGGRGILCGSLGDFPLFTPQVWRDRDNPRAAKVLQDKFSVPPAQKAGLWAALESGGAGRDSLDRLLAMAGAAFFLGGDAPEAPDSGDPPPVETPDCLGILFLSHRRMVLGTRGEPFPLGEGRKYTALLSCAAPGGRRVIRGSLVAGGIAAWDGDGRGKKTRRAVLCDFTEIEPEDQRFLFEKLYGAKLL